MSKTVFKGLAVASALSLGAISFASSADAGGRHNRHHSRGHHGGHNGGSAAAAAILGFGLATALTSRPSYGYSYGYAPPYAYAPPPPPYYGPAAYSSNYAPPTWSPGWYQYCAAKWRSFDSRDGTFQPNFGPRRLCY